MDALTSSGTDPLTGLLNGVRTTGAVFNRAVLDDTWAVRFENGSPLGLAVPLTGPSWVIPQDREPVRLEPGDVAVLSGSIPYTVACAPAAAPDVIIRPGGLCVTPDGTEQNAYDSGRPSLSGADRSVLLNGFYTVPTGTPGRQLAALPSLAVVPAGQGACPISLAAFEDACRPASGQQVLRDRMLDLMLITALRTWFTRPGAPVPAWYRAHSDPIVGHALRLLATDLSHPWTVASLAAKTGVSRAALARRFTTLIGHPPMTYLREQRIARAADLLREPGTTIGAVAAQVGFSSAFALSAAFKRVRGSSPTEYRSAEARIGD
ncbi:AraC family transcriptional regulator [Streptomyces tanashiensis]|uniref:AraC family transcriptional regulator n=1 Tax=Streptomyces tanashiensis TaxID=67367 RepID=UPI0036E65CFF